jgi:general secretion pathway protein F
VAETNATEVETKQTSMAGILEPLMIVIMGGAIACVVFSILQPIMSMGSFTGPR